MSKRMAKLEKLQEDVDDLHSVVMDAINAITAIGRQVDLLALEEANDSGASEGSEI